MEKEMYKRLILYHHKDLCKQSGVLFIDDRTKHVAMEFEERFILFGKEKAYRFATI